MKGGEVVADRTPQVEDWHRLYDAFDAITELTPWTFLTEADVFGVQDPETERLAFASVMGELGEQPGVAVYLGAEGLYGFWEMARADPATPAERMLEIPHLQAFLADRDELEDEDRGVIRKLDRTYRGSGAWPRFRSVRPGCMPWFLEADEVRLLAQTLEQARDVIARARDNPDLLEPPDEESYLVRVPDSSGEDIAWTDQILAMPPPEPTPIPVAMDDDLLAEARQLPRTEQVLEVDCVMIPAAIGEPGTRPLNGYALLAVDHDSGFIISVDILTPDPSLEEMWGEVPYSLVQQLATAGFVPKAVRVRSDLIHQLLQLLADELDVDVRQSAALPALDEAQASLSDYLQTSP